MKLYNLLLETDLNLSEDEINKLKYVLSRLDMFGFYSSEDIQCSLQFKTNNDKRKNFSTYMSNDEVLEFMDGVINDYRYYAYIFAETKKSSNKINLKNFLSIIYIDAYNAIKKKFKDSDIDDHITNEFLSKIKFNVYFMIEVHGIRYDIHDLNRKLEPEQLTNDFLKKVNETVASSEMFNINQEQLEHIRIEAEKIKEIFLLYSDIEIDGKKYHIKNFPELSLKLPSGHNPNLGIYIGLTFIRITDENGNVVSPYESPTTNDIKNYFSEILDNFNIYYPVTFIT